MILSDAQGRVEWVNAGFTRLTGYTLEEMRGKKPGEVLQCDETDRATAAFAGQQLAKGEGFSMEILNRAKSGRHYWVYMEIQPIRDEAGGITNYMAIETDITQRRAAEARLRVSEARTRALLDAIPDLILRVGEDGVLRDYKAPSEPGLDLPADRLVGRHLGELLPPGLGAQVWAA